MKLHDTAAMLTSYTSHIAVVRPYQSNLNEPNTLTQLRCVRNSIIQLKNKRVLNKTQSGKRMCFMKAQAND